MRVVAVDWSGRSGNPGAAIWFAEVADGTLVRLEGGRDRDELVEHLAAEAERDPQLVVGLDFAFSFPAPFVLRHARSAVDFWDVVARHGEEWLERCEPPFWRGRGIAPLPTQEAFRRTELEHAVGGIRPTSVFKLVGASQVGAGSLRGIPFLTRLRGAGFSVWPIDDLSPPGLVEIWPRILTRAVVKTRRADREAYLRGVPEIREPLLGVAASTDDTFDAAVSAAIMWRHRDELLGLRRDPAYALEGRIWAPREPVRCRG